LMNSNPSKTKQPARPVEDVSWEEANTFCQKLTEFEKKGGTLPSGFIYSLPTQGQWDGLLADAKFDDGLTSRGAVHTETAPVGTASTPNRLGLYDVLGNVWEWCADGETSGTRIAKGGAFSTKTVFEWKQMERTTGRKLAADARAPDVGFRCVLVPALAQSAAK